MTPAESMKIINLEIDLTEAKNGPGGQKPSQLENFQVAQETGTWQGVMDKFEELEALQQERRLEIGEEAINKFEETLEP